MQSPEIAKLKNPALVKVQAIYFRDQLRAARAIALRDAEGYQAILFTVERLGMALHGRILDLGKYRSKLEQLAGASPLASEPAFARHLHIPFSVLYDLVRNARNDALHQGAYVRHLTRHAVSLSLVLEDALMSQHDTCVGNLVYDGSDGNQPVNDVEEAMEKLRAVWEEATRAGRDRST